jgi:hypothetical protein
MKPLFLTLLLGTLCTTGYGQTIKALGYNTTNGQVVYTSTNTLTLTNSQIKLGSDFIFFTSTGFLNFGTNAIFEALTSTFFQPVIFVQAAATRTNLGIPLPALTNTNNANFRTAIGVSPATIWAYKATNQTNATTNLVSDTALTFTAAANTKYAVELFLIIGAGTDGIAGSRISTTNSPSVFGYWNSSDPANNGFNTTGISVTDTGTILIPDGGDPASLLNKFTVVGPTNTNAPITFQFVNQSTNGGAVIIGAGSYLKAEVIE